MCPYELALKLHELGVNSESEFYFVKEMKGGRRRRYGDFSRDKGGGIKNKIRKK